MTSKLYLFKRSNGVYYIGFFEDVQRQSDRREVRLRVQEEVRRLTAGVWDSHLKQSPEIADKTVDKLDAKVGRDEGGA